MNLTDRYILRQLVMTLVFSLIALCVIFIIVNLLESLDEFLDQSAPVEIIGQYYLYYLPEILKLLMPVAMLLSILFTIGKLSTLNEITAMKSGGLSLYRLMFPLALFAILISGGHLYFNGWIVPEANSRKIEIERKYLKKTAGGGQLFNLYFRDSPQTNVTMQYYNAQNRKGHKVAIEKYSDDTNPRLLTRLESDQMQWDADSNGWKMINGLVRSYKTQNADVQFFDTLAPELSITHAQIVRLRESPEEMNLDELRRYIDMLGRGGKDVRKMMIDYYGQYAYPFANFIVVLFGVPFASVRKKGGIAIQIGAAMVVSFFYLIFTKFGQEIGYAADINPIISAWMANGVFFIAGLVVLFRTKT
ncbi:MAG: LptF/LptG family permease [Candidatus Kapaibacterium sp.]